MPKITFIRHAEPVRFGDDFDRGLTEEGQNLAIDYRENLSDEIKKYKLVACSYMKRAKDTAKTLFYHHKSDYYYYATNLKEYDKTSEEKEDFINRVRNELNFLMSHKMETLVISHARFMTVAHQILKPGEIVLGFDFLEGFEYEF